MNQFELADAHMRDRWEYLGKRGWQGEFTREHYMRVNRDAVLKNLSRGMVSDGSGFWIDPAMPNGPRLIATLTRKVG